MLTRTAIYEGTVRDGREDEVLPGVCRVNWSHSGAASPALSRCAFSGSYRRTATRGPSR